MNASQSVYQPQPLVVDQTQALNPAQGFTQPVMVIQASKPEPAGSWLSTHKTDVIAAGGAGVLAITLMLTLAIVAVAVAIGAISCALGWLVLRSAMGPQIKK